MAVRVVEEEDIAWLACAVDGEGTICVDKDGRCQVAVYNTNRKFVEKAAMLMGAKVYKLNRKSSEHRLVYSAYTNKKMTVLKVLKQIESRLIIKRTKAIQAIRTILDYYDIADIELRTYPSLP